MTSSNQEQNTKPITLSVILRSLIFNFYFYLSVTFCIVFIFTPLSFLKSPNPMRGAILKWINVTIYFFEHISKVRIEERGIENIPLNKGFIFCSKHMSNMDALILYRRAPNLTALAKQELFLVPLLNLIFKKMGVLPIKRGAGVAQKQTPFIAKTIFDKKIPLIIFAEGTRTIPLERRKLKSGTYYYQNTEDLDVIVVAHNSGKFWPKKSWLKWPGKLVVEYFPVMPKNLSKEDFMDEIEVRLQDRSEELML